MNADLTKEVNFILKIIFISMMIGSCITALLLYRSPQIVYHVNTDRCDTNKYQISYLPDYDIEPPSISFDNTAEHDIPEPPNERELTPYQIMKFLPDIHFDPPPKP